MSTDFQIFCLVPDMPAPSLVEPYLQEMHANRWYTNFGPLNSRFEKEMADFFAAQGSPGLATGTFSSATTGLELMLRAMNLPEKGKVLIPALTFPATALAVMNAGLTPIFADVDAGSWELMPEAARNALEDHELVAVMPVAAFGRPIEMTAWQAFQAETGVPVLVDAAAVLGQQPVPEDITAVFSLHATKPFGVGEGGLVVTTQQDVLERAKSLSNFGFQGSAGVVQQTGTNAKFGEYYAAVGLAQIRRWPEVAAARRRVAALYRDRLAPLMNKIRLQDGFETFVPAVFPVFAKGKREAVQAAMAEAGIQTRHWYLPLLHRHPALKHLNFAGSEGEQSAPVCLEMEDSLVGLPFHAFLSETDIERICAVLAKNV